MVTNIMMNFELAEQREAEIRDQAAIYVEAGLGAGRAAGSVGYGSESLGGLKPRFRMAGIDRPAPDHRRPISSQRAVA